MKCTGSFSKPKAAQRLPQYTGSKRTILNYKIKQNSNQDYHCRENCL